MSTRAFCFAAVAVLLCLNLVSCWTLGPSPIRPEPSWRSSGDPRTFSGRSETGEELVMDGNDLVLTMTQYRRLHEEGKGRLVVRPATIPWDGGVIPYYIQPGTFSQDKLEWIYKAMENWQKDTCVKFRKASGIERNVVRIMDGGGCYAGLGMQGGKQDCSLADGCFYRGAIEHELGHTLGLIHEHQRENRDDYIKINYFAIQKDMLFQINKYAKGADDKHGLPYDYYSVMHYDKSAFASPDSGKQTMYPRMMNKTDVIGMVMGPSFYDIKLINLMYNCKDRCRYPPACPEPCFVNENCKCVCENVVPEEECKDQYRNCADRASMGECETKKKDMLHNCRQSCGVCTSKNRVAQLPCADENSMCLASDCGDSQQSHKCKKTCGLCENNSVQPPCVDTAYGCRQKADEGQCESNLETMLKECRRSCDFCLDERLPPRQCEDEDTMCVFLQTQEACEKFHFKTSQFCKRSCNNCDGRVVLPANCEDRDPQCFSLAWSGKCQTYGGICKQSCNKCGPSGGVNHSCRDIDPAYCRDRRMFACMVPAERKKCPVMCADC